jgi:hypothetical protein
MTSYKIIAYQEKTLLLDLSRQAVVMGKITQDISDAWAKTLGTPKCELWLRWLKFEVTGQEPEIKGFKQWKGGM